MAYVEEHLLPRIWHALTRHGADQALIDEVEAAIPQGVPLPKNVAAHNLAWDAESQPALAEAEETGENPDSQHPLGLAPGDPGVLRIGRSAATAQEMVDRGRLQASMSEEAAKDQAQPAVIPANPESVDTLDPKEGVDKAAVRRAVTNEGMGATEQRALEIPTGTDLQSDPGTVPPAPTPDNPVPIEQAKEAAPAWEQVITSQQQPATAPEPAQPPDPNVSGSH